MKSAGRSFSCTATLLTLSTVFACSFLSLTTVSSAEGLKVLPEGKQPADKRLQPPKDLNGYFPFTPPKTPQEWNRRAENLRRRMLVSFGLWPMPTRTPLNSVIHGRIDRGDYTVEKAYFESFPGFYVTGSLYRPKGKKGKLPGVLCPHGHWANGRFYDTGQAAVREQIEQGAEKFEEGGRSPLQARCVQLARMGCVVFHYDMIGYADNTQISFAVSHRFAKQRPEMNSPKNWGLFSPQAESHLQSVMGMQTYNSIRALDFLSSLDDVDSKRLAVTGASGGGTQTFAVCAVDPRPAVAFPAVMVSTAMQGGCTCENCTDLRISAGNVEFAALFAPKPLAMSAADDWTKEMKTKGFPELQQHYKMLGAADKVMLSSHTEFGHNYNAVNRSAMYHWFNKYLGLGQKEPIVERDYQRLTTEQMTVWDDKHPRPESGDALERKVLSWWHDDARKQLAALTPRDAKSLNQFREIVGGAVDTTIGRNLLPGSQIEWDQTDKKDRGDYLEIVGLLNNETLGESLPTVFLHPKQWESQTVIWIDPQGKAGLYDEGGRPKPAVQKLLDAGATVIGVDLLYQGEFLTDGKPITQTRRVTNKREAAAYTFGFNDTLFARRVHDILTVVSFVENHELKSDKIDLVGLNGAGAWVAAARAQARDVVTRAVVDTEGFRFGNVRKIHSPNFLPGGAKYGDLPGMLALSAPDKLWLAGEGKQAPAVIRAAYRAAGEPDGLTTYSSDADQKTNEAVMWLLDNKPSPSVKVARCRNACLRSVARRCATNRRRGFAGLRSCRN